MLKYHIQTIEVGAAGATDIAFSNIPQIYDDLLIIVSGRSTRTTGNDWFFVAPNSSTANITSRMLWGDGTTRYSDTVADIMIPDSSSTANTFGNAQIYISGYRTSQNKSFSVDSVRENNGTFAAQQIIANLWSNTAAITSLNLVSVSGRNFVQYSSASLYGIKRGSDGKTEVASGGTISYSGGYTIHTFNSSGTFVANRDMDVEYLVIGGGGSGSIRGNNPSANGGGGAGGYRCSVVGESSGGGSSAEPKLRVNAGASYSIIVGAGGAGVASNSTNLPGNKGSNSVFAEIISEGGGLGGINDPNPAGSGGSGGGAGSPGTISLAGGNGATNQGYKGGDNFGSSTSSQRAGGGGGGAGAAGGNGSSDAPGTGGNGVASSITGTSITRAGGGGGTRGGDSTSGTASGGTGGGSAGIWTASTNAATSSNGTANTGSGSGGAKTGGSATATSGNGGSGVVIIRYLTPAS